MREIETIVSGGITLEGGVGGIRENRDREDERLCDRDLTVGVLCAENDPRLRFRFHERSRSRWICVIEI